MITRAMTLLAVIILNDYDYAETKEYFQQAGDLIEDVQLSAEEIY